MAEIVTLNKVRKAKAKAEKQQLAQTNRVLHGLTKAEKQKALVEARKKSGELDGKKLS